MSNRRIVEAAVKLFSRQGYHGTSTRKIARKAGVSENTLFRHFACKEDLFLSALRSCSAPIMQSAVLVKIRSGESLQAVLPQILEALSETATRRPEVLRLFSAAFVELQSKAEELCKTILSPVLSEVSDYLAKSAAKGEVLEVDPSLLMASLTATAFMHGHFVRLTTKKGDAPMNEREAVRAYSKFWLDVLAPRSAALPTIQSIGLIPRSRPIGEDLGPARESTYHVELK
jgi:AcrR family transcriptional regulator